MLATWASITLPTTLRLSWSFGLTCCVSYLTLVIFFSVNFSLLLWRLWTTSTFVLTLGRGTISHSIITVSFCHVIVSCTSICSSAIIILRTQISIQLRDQVSFIKLSIFHFLLLLSFFLFFQFLLIPPIILILPYFDLQILLFLLVLLVEVRVHVLIVLGQQVLVTYDIYPGNLDVHGVQVNIELLDVIN